MTYLFSVRPSEWERSWDTDTEDDRAAPQSGRLLPLRLLRPSTPAGNAPGHKNKLPSIRAYLTSWNLTRGCSFSEFVLTISTSPSATARSSFSTCQSHKTISKEPRDETRTALWYLSVSNALCLRFDLWPQRRCAGHRGAPAAAVWRQRRATGRLEQRDRKQKQKIILWAFISTQKLLVLIEFSNPFFKIFFLSVLLLITDELWCQNKQV